MIQSARRLLTTNHRRKTQPMDYDRFLTAASLRRKPSAIRALQPLLAIPGMISLGGGMPNPSTFPFARFQVTLKDGHQLELDDQETSKALQYSATAGLPEFVQDLMSLQIREHSPPNPSLVDLCVGNGSQECLSKAFDMLVAEGDNLLVESPLYSGTLALLRPIGCKLHAVQTDSDGLMPDSLRAVLTGWNVESMGTRPKVLYTVPTASNPSGCTTPMTRKQEIYSIAQEFNLLIMEDDPYYYLQFGDTRERSYFSIDVDGRVLRFDSFSKILSSGMRMGFVTGPKPLIDRIVLHSQASNLHPNGPSQLLLFKLMKYWGHDKFMLHVRDVCALYRARRDHIIRCMDIELKGLAEWTVPAGGMFLWVRINRVKDTRKLIKERAVDKKVLCLPGAEFMPGGGDSPYIRIAYSTASETEMTEAVKRLRSLLESI
eukprot:Partr_v1_DN28566_c0_g1_i1_m73330 putative Aminotransferase